MESKDLVGFEVKEQSLKLEGKDLVGFEVKEQSLKLEGKDLVGVVSAHHVGKIGSLKVSLEGTFEFLPLVHKAIDKLEELIPGDQKPIAEALKLAVSNLKVKI